MKRIFTTVVLVVLVMALLACDNTEKSTDSGISTTVYETETDITTGSETHNQSEALTEATEQTTAEQTTAEQTTAEQTTAEQIAGEQTTASEETTAYDLDENRPYYTTPSGYYVYCDVSESIYGNAIKEYKLKNYKDLEFVETAFMPQHISPKENIEKTISFNGKDTKVKFAQTLEHKTDNEKFSALLDYCIYYGDGIGFNIRKSDDRIVGYRYTDDSKERLDISELEKIYKQFLKDNLGDEYLSNFTQTYDFPYVDSYGNYCAEYSRCLYGIPTEDRIHIKVQANGNVCFFQEYNMSFFDGYEQLYDEETIKNAEEEFLDFIGKNIGDPYRPSKIILSTNGNIVLKNSVDILVKHDGQAELYIVGLFIEIPMPVKD